MKFLLHCVSIRMSSTPLTANFLLDYVLCVFLIYKSESVILSLIYLYIYIYIYKIYMSIRIPLKKPKIKHYPITGGCILKNSEEKKREQREQED